MTLEEFLGPEDVPTPVETISDEPQCHEECCERLSDPCWCSNEYEMSIARPDEPQYWSNLYRLWYGKWPQPLTMEAEKLQAIMDSVVLEAYEMDVLEEDWDYFPGRCHE